MNYAEYVVTGWVLTAVTVGGYWLWIVRRTKRAEASLPASSEVEVE